MRGMLFLGLAFVIFTAKAASTVTPDPSQIVQDTSEKILSILNRDSERLRNNPQEVQRLVDEILVPVIDLNAFSKLILGHNWRTASTEQRQRFTEEFKGMLMRTYTKYLVDYSGTRVNLIPSRQPQRNSKREKVSTEVIQPGKPPLAVDYSFWFKDGKWKAYNVTVDGLSLVHLFRNDFNREISETSLDALIERLAKTNLEKGDKNPGHRGSIK